jgi:hypothetical protein
MESLFHLSRRRFFWSTAIGGRIGRGNLRFPLDGPFVLLPTFFSVSMQSELVDHALRDQLSLVVEFTYTDILLPAIKPFSTNQHWNSFRYIPTMNKSQSVCLLWSAETSHFRVLSSPSSAS